MGGMREVVLEEYEAVRRDAGLIRLDNRAKIQVTGPDRTSFLHSMISNDVEALETGSGRYATFLTSKGKIVADFYVYKLTDRFLVDVDSTAASPFVETLSKYIIMEEVELQDISSILAHYSVQGPKAAEILSSLLGDPLPESPLALCESSWKEEAIQVVAKADFGSRGYEVFVPAASAQAFREEALRAGGDLGIREIGLPTWDVLRIEEGIPAFGSELDETRYPMEARLDQALDFKKGCYIGQEVVAKATYIGGVARLLVRLILEGERVPPDGSPIQTEEGRKVGQVTSAAFSPALGRPIALGYVKRALAQPGQQLAVRFPEAVVPARLVEAFLEN